MNKLKEFRSIKTNMLELRTEKYSRKVYSNTIVQKFRVSFFFFLDLKA